MSDLENAAFWRGISDTMEKHAENKSMKPVDVALMAALSLFAWEISHAYTLKNHRIQFPEAHANA